MSTVDDEPPVQPARSGPDGLRATASDHAEAAAILASLDPRSVEQMPVGAVTLDAEGRVLFANEELARMARQLPEAMAGRPLAEFAHPEDRDRVRRVLEAGFPRGRFRVGRPDHWSTSIMNGWPIESPAGAVVALFMLDVTPQIELERLSRQAQRRSVLLDNVGACVVAVDIEERVTEWSARAEQWFGVPREEALGREVASLDLGRFVEAGLSEPILASLRRDRSWSGRIRLRTADGDTLPVDGRAGTVHDDAGEPMGMVMFLFDVSDQVEAEQRAERADHYLRAVSDQMVEGMIVGDEEAGVTYVSAGAERLLGYSAAELIGAEDLHALIHGADADGSVNPAGRSVLSQVRHGFADRLEADDEVLVRADGSLLPVALSASSFEAPNGARGFSLVFRDTAEERAEAERLRSERECMSWVGPIRRALEEDTFQLHGQPIVELGSGKVVATELLLRAQDEKGHVVPASRFLPAAERYGLIKDIDRWVISRAIPAAVELGTTVQFNLSPDSLEDPATLTLIERALTESGIDPGVIVVEVTESGMIDDHEIAERFARRIQSLGCKLALDDFGTGYGGFTYLTNLDVSILKIDQAFVRDLLTDEASRKVVRAVVRLASEFGQKTIAEGVEDAETMKLLVELGVDRGQGYHLGLPVPLPSRT